MGLKQSDLMSGPWEKLLPSALTLVDELSKHGGAADPFFTFGGGTVLMLRYQHRFSKDIDIFVPDPQSLGYVNPRLSAVAEELCNSQYLEAGNFVKLVLEEGEIDFVASPNLLPHDKAFDEWELFGRRVRVETAAEIVAKKMYHRGGQATARDLFDLALVVEREADALADAVPFMHRHLNAFRNNLKSASDNFIVEFNSVLRIDYSPTFEHAVDVATRYLDGLEADKKRSKQEALDFVKQHGLTASIVDESRGEYCGPIVHRTSAHLVQSLGRGAAAIHDLHNLPPNFPTTADEATTVRVRYRNGDMSLTTKPSRG